MAALIVELNAAAETWVSVVWGVVWQSTLLIGIIALVAALALRRSSPALRFWVWQILALKLLLMPFWTCAVAVPRSVPAAEDEFAASEAAAAAVGSGTSVPNSDSVADAALPAFPAEPPPFPASAKRPQFSAAAAVTWQA